MVLRCSVVKIYNLYKMAHPLFSPPENKINERREKFTRSEEVDVEVLTEISVSS
jgi:hypothetical protein